MGVLNCQLGSEQQHSEQLLPFENLYSQYSMRVYRYFRAHLGNDEDAADLTQQVFFQVWMHLSTYQPAKGSFATWLLSIAHHRLIDFVRAVHSSVSWETLSHRATTDRTPEEIVIATETTQRVKELLDALPCSERKLLALRFTAKLSIAEIARIIGKSEEATKKQLTRLITRLQQHYRYQEEQWQQPDRQDIVSLKDSRFQAQRYSSISTTGMQNDHASAA